MTGPRAFLGLAAAATLLLTGCSIPLTSDEPPTPPVASVPSSVVPLDPSEQVPAEPVLDPTCREVDADNLKRAADLVGVYWDGRITKSAMVDAGREHFVIAVKISGAKDEGYGTGANLNPERDRATFVSQERSNGTVWFTEVADGWTDLPTSQSARAAALDCLGR